MAPFITAVYTGVATINVGDTTITGNGTGLLKIGQGTINSYGDNRLNGNATDGTFSAIIPQQ